MNVSPVSFAGVTSDFKKKVESPQVYKQSEAPAASTKLGESSKKKSSPVKTAVLLLVQNTMYLNQIKLRMKPLKKHYLIFKPQVKLLQAL